VVANKTPQPKKPSEVLEELRARKSKGLLRQREVLELIGISRIELWRRYKRGAFPEPVRIGRDLRWKAEEVFRWIDSLPRASKAPGLKVGVSE